VYRLATVKSAVSLLALAGAGLPIVAVPASAAPATATPATATTAPSATYSCGLASYAQGLAPLTILAALNAQSAGGTVTVSLTTQPVTLPAAMATALPRFSYLGIAGAAPSNGMSAAAVKLSGRGGHLGAATGSPAQLPAMTATGTVPAGGGLTTVAFPPALTLTPEGAGSAPPLTCTTPTAVTVQVAAAGGPAATGGYTCAVTAGTSTTTVTGVRMRLATAAPATSGTPDTLMLSAPASALGPAFPASATPMAASGLASLAGPGGTMAGVPLTVPLTEPADAGNGMFRLTGSWTPRVPGMVRIIAPRRFTARLREQTAVTVSVACTAATATTTTTQVMVQVAASTAGTASASAPAAAAPAAPDTGGGGSLRPGSDLPLAAGGGAALLAGLAIVLYALRRRRGAAG
jgi:hypothetical protein